MLRHAGWSKVCRGGPPCPPVFDLRALPEIVVTITATVPGGVQHQFAASATVTKRRKGRQ